MQLQAVSASDVLPADQLGMQSKRLLLPMCAAGASSETSEAHYGSYAEASAGESCLQTDRVDELEDFMFWQHGFLPSMTSLKTESPLLQPHTDPCVPASSLCSC